jgi:hypothetical protein
MASIGIGNMDIFSATIQQSAQLETLANGALRKGIDLYVEAGLELCGSLPYTYFVWIGHWEMNMEKQIDSMLKGKIFYCLCQFRIWFHFCSFHLR